MKQLCERNLSRTFSTNKMGIFAILFTIIFVHLQYFSYSYYPTHDTLAVFQFFSHYYSQLLETGEPPMWLPYAAYGLPIESYIVFSFGPFQYLALLLGYIFKIQNSLNLFSLSLIGDTIFLAMSSYIFCRHILKDPWSPIFCVISLILLVHYDRQIYWNFKILLPIPIGLYFAQKAVENLNPLHFLLSGATLLCFAFGGLPYTVPFQFYLISIYSAIIFFVNYKQSASYRNRSWMAKQIMKHISSYKNLVCILIVLLLIAVFGAMMHHINHVMKYELAYIIGGRNLDLGVPLDSFLTHGGFTDSKKILELLTDAPILKTNFLPFVGIVNLVFIVYGLFHIKIESSQIALTVIVFLTIGFSISGTGIAHVMYYLPFMKIFRHIGYVLPVGKMLFIMLAGFGVHEYLHSH